MISITVNDANHAKLDGQIAHDEAKTCQQLFFRFLKERQGAVVTIDLSGLTSVSSITLSFLLSGLRQAKINNIKLNYCNVPNLLFNMARVSGIDEILVESE